MENEKIKLFLVDDDILYTRAMELEFLEHGDFSIETFTDGESCVKNLASSPDVIILDYKLDGVNSTNMNGLDTLDEIMKINPDIAVVMLSSQDKIDVAINCMHHRAFDYVVKSETAFLRLQKIISTIFRYKKMEKELTWYMERM